MFHICCNTTLCIYSVSPALMRSTGSGNATLWVCFCSASHLFRVYFSTGGEIKQKCKGKTSAHMQRSWVLLVGFDLIKYCIFIWGVGSIRIRSRVGKLPLTGSLTIWGFCTLLKGTSAVARKCPSTSSTLVSFQNLDLISANIRQERLISCSAFYLSAVPTRQTWISEGHRALTVQNIPPPSIHIKSKQIIGHMFVSSGQTKWAWLFFLFIYLF